MTAIIIISAIILFFVFLLASFVKVELEYDAEFFVKVKYLCFTLFMMPKSKRKLKKEKKKEEKERKKQEKLRKKKHKGQHLKTADKKKPSKGSRNGVRSLSLEDGQSTQSEKSRNSTNTDFENRSSESGNVKVQKTVNAKKEKDEKKDGKTDKPKPGLEMILGCIKAAKPYVKRLFKKIRFDDVFVEIVVGGDDAAKTAVSYGVHCAAAHGLVCFLKNTVSFKAKKIDIKANFDLEKTDYYAYGKIKLRLSTLLFCAIWGFFAVYKVMKSDNASNRTNSNNSKDTVKKAA